MDQKSMRLPIRFVEDGADLFTLVFALGVLGVFTYFDVKIFNALLWGYLSVHPLRIVWWCVLIGQFVVLLAIAYFLLLPMLLSRIPGGPYYYTEIAGGTIGTRKAWQFKRFKWQDLSAFSVHREDRFRKHWHTTYYWVIARARQDDSGPDESGRPVLKLLALNFGADNTEKGAAKVADWLNRQRDEAIGGAGLVQTEILVPAPFHKAAETVAVSPRQSASANSAIVER